MGGLSIDTELSSSVKKRLLSLTQAYFGCTLRSAQGLERLNPFYHEIK